MRRPSEILGLSQQVLDLSGSFVNGHFFPNRGSDGLPTNAVDPLETAWAAGRGAGRPLQALNQEAAAVAARQRRGTDVPGARVQARVRPSAGRDIG